MKSSKTQKSLGLLPNELPEQIESRIPSPKRMKSLSKQFKSKSGKEVRRTRAKSFSKIIYLTDTNPKRLKKRSKANSKRKNSLRKPKSPQRSTKKGICAKKELNRQEKAAKIKSILRSLLKDEHESPDIIIEQIQLSNSEDEDEHDQLYNQIKNMPHEESQLVSQFKEFLLNKQKELELKYKEIHECKQNHLTRKYNSRNISCESEDNSENNTEESHVYSDESFMDLYAFSTQTIQCLPEILSEEEPGTVIDYFDTVILDEIDNYLGILSFNIKEKEVDPSFTFLYSLTNELSNMITSEEDEFLKIYRKSYSPLQLIAEIQENRPLKLELILDSLVSDLLLSKFNPKNLYTRGHYILMAFDCMNEALNYIKPKTQLPWSKIPHSNHTEKPAVEVIEDLQQLLYEWWNIKLGKIGSDVIRYDSLRKMTEMEDWNNYEQEELQTVCEASNDIFNGLVQEILFILH